MDGDNKDEAIKYSNQKTGNCTASYSFCRSTTGPCSSTSPLITMRSSQGSIYANFIGDGDSFVPVDS